MKTATFWLARSALPPLGVHLLEMGCLQYRWSDSLLRGLMLDSLMAANSSA